MSPASLPGGVRAGPERIVGDLVTQQTEVPVEVVARIRAVCLALPEVYEEEAWVGTRWRVRARTFAHVLTVDAGWPPAYARAAGTDGPSTVLMFRSSDPELGVLRSAGHPFFGPPWRADEVGMVLEAGVDWDRGRGTPHRELLRRRAAEPRPDGRPTGGLTARWARAQPEVRWISDHAARPPLTSGSRAGRSDRGTLGPVMTVMDDGLGLLLSGIGMFVFFLAADRMEIFRRATEGSDSGLPRLAPPSREDLLLMNHWIAMLGMAISVVAGVGGALKLLF